MKIAFATQDREHVDAHFGWARNIAIYWVTGAGAQLLATHTFDDAAREDGNEDKLAPRIEAIEGCTILYAAAIGGSAASRVVARGVHPARAREDEGIDGLLVRLVELLAGNPPPWLRKAMSRSAELELSV
jgi:nitrogen fixation protein NifX